MWNFTGKAVTAWKVGPRGFLSQWRRTSTRMQWRLHWRALLRVQPLGFVQWKLQPRTSSRILRRVHLLCSSWGKVHQWVVWLMGSLRGQKLPWARPLPPNGRKLERELPKPIDGSICLLLGHQWKCPLFSQCLHWMSNKSVFQVILCNLTYCTPGSSKFRAHKDFLHV